MNVGIRNLMKGRVGERGYEGESLTGEGIHSFGRRILDFGGGSILEGDESTGFMAWFFWFCGRVLQTVSIIAGGTGLLGVLGTGARIPFGFLELGSRTGCS
jgi:hypothetical protein